jgi:hypothetical protein
MIEAILQALRETWTGYFVTLQSVLPRLLAMLSVVVAGWIVAAVSRAVIRKLLVWFHLERLSERTGIAELLRKAELPPLERLVASAAFWLLLLLFLFAAIDALGFDVLAALRHRTVMLLPRLATSFVIVVAGIVLANFAWRVTLLAAVNAGWPWPRTVSGVVHTLLLTVSVVMALDHLGVARAVVLTAFAIAFGALTLAFAIALGIGGGAVVRQLLEDRWIHRRRPEGDGSSHL